MHDHAVHPLSLYAATKMANEAMAHSYAYLFGLPTTGLRFFTVYGPWGRPDMALFKFTRAILEGAPIDVYGEGRMQRDFTYIDDIVAGVLAALERPADIDPAWNPEAPDPATSGVAPWRMLNLGAGRRTELMRYIEVLEDKLGAQGGNPLPADAARRRHPHRGRGRREPRRDRLRPGDPGRGGRRAIRGLVPGLLRRLSDP